MLASTPEYVRNRPEGALLSVRVQPRASKEEIGEVSAGELRVKVSAAPVDNAANDAVRRLLAEALGCSRGNVQLLKGQTSRHKLFLVAGMSAETVTSRLRARAES